MSKVSIPFAAGDISALARSLRKQLSAGEVPPGHVELLNMLARGASLRRAGAPGNWPAQARTQGACLWVVWSKLAASTVWTENELNRELRALHLFGDHALLRRELCDRGMIRRTADGREYRRVERRPEPDGLALMRRIAGGPL